jgi:hypothetical protein
MGRAATLILDVFANDDKIVWRGTSSRIYLLSMMMMRAWSSN